MLNTHYTDSEGNGVDLTGDNAQELAEQLPEDFQGNLTVRDEHGFVRGWIHFGRLGVWWMLMPPGPSKAEQQRALMHHSDEIDHQEHAAVDDMMREEFGEETEVRAQALRDIRAVRAALYRGQRSAAKYAAQEAFARLVGLLERGLLLALVLVMLPGCGGAEFSTAAELGGDAGAPDIATQAGESSVAGTGGALTAAGSGGSAGSVAAGGSAAGASTGGSDGALGGAAGSNAAGSAGAPACELDASKLTAALPTRLHWKEFNVTDGSFCAYCTWEPCGHVDTKWGEPTVHSDVVTYQPVYSNPLGGETAPGAPAPALEVNVGSSADGTCSSKICDVDPMGVSVQVTAARSGAGWAIASAEVKIRVDDSCSPSLATHLEPSIEADAQSELVGLKFGCK